MIHDVLEVGTSTTKAVTPISNKRHPAKMLAASVTLNGSLSNTLKYKGRQKHDDVFIYLFSYTQIEVEVDNRMEY